MRLSWGLPVSFKFIRLVLFTGRPTILEGSSCLGDQIDTCWSPGGVCPNPTFKCSQGRASPGFKAVRLAWPSTTCHREHQRDGRW